MMRRLAGGGAHGWGRRLAVPAAIVTITRCETEPLEPRRRGGGAGAVALRGAGGMGDTLLIRAVN